MNQNSILLAFAVGAFCPNYFSTLPSAWLMGAICCLLTSLVVRFRGRYLYAAAWLVSLFIGLFWGNYQALSLQERILPQPLDSQIFQIHAEVQSIQRSSDRSQRYILNISDVEKEDGTRLRTHPKKVLLSWYGYQTLTVGQELIATAKLRRPRGLNNPGLFDYQRWLIAQDIEATGYIRDIIELSDSRNRSIDRVSYSALEQHIANWRERKAAVIEGHESLNYPEVHQALAIGKGDVLSRDSWDLFRLTGTAHLIVISGLHVGLVGVLGYLIGFNLGRILAVLRGGNAVRIGILTSLVMAGLYALASGFGLPAQRALIMMAAILIPRLFFLKTSRWFGFSLALALVAIFEPQAVLQTGFWLSFGAVFILFLGARSRDRGWFGYVRSLLQIQVLFLTSFFGVLLWQGIAVSPVSLIANLISVPLVALCLVPLEVIALMISLVSSGAAEYVWIACDWLVGLEMGFLRYLNAMDIPRLQRPPNWGLAQSIAVLCAVFIWAVPGRYLRFLIAIGCMPLILPAVDDEYVLRMHVFDVGQGLSVLVQQPGYSLLYDTGPKFSSRFDSGADLIAPSLRRFGIDSLDRLVVSHSDADHRGGLEGLLSNIPVKQIDIGQALTFSDNQIMHACQQGQSWQQNAIRYRYLWPDGGEQYSDNDSSCVLLIEALNLNGSGKPLRVIIPGDISKSAERQLMEKYSLAEIGNLDVILAPHHGSKTSSSARFVLHTSPDLAVVSAGYKNQFRHPHPDVIERYKNAGVETLVTGNTGAITLVWRTLDTEPEVTLASASQIFWWQK